MRPALSLPVCRFHAGEGKLANETFKHGIRPGRAAGRSATMWKTRLKKHLIPSYSQPSVICAGGMDKVLALR